MATDHERKILAIYASLNYAERINQGENAVSGINKHYGFSISAVLLAVLIVTTLTVTSLTVYQRSSAAVATPSQTTEQPAGSSAIQLVYNDAAYGLSYSYPADGTPSGGVPNNPKTSATRQEFGTDLRLNNSNAVQIEVLDESLQTAEVWYDQYYAQTPIKVSKTTDTLKGRQSVQYHFVAPTYETKQYLFAVGSKTYLFSSINESLNVSTSANYWSTFDNIFTSLTIQK